MGVPSVGGREGSGVRGWGCLFVFWRLGVLGLLLFSFSGRIMYICGVCTILWNRAAFTGEFSRVILVDYHDLHAGTTKPSKDIN